MQFIRYVSNRTQLLLALGMSAISDSASAYCQNVKDIRQYTELIGNGILPILKGHVMSNEDKIIKEVSIPCGKSSLMCLN
jgi:oxygen-independent coproporphyrinogen III oxidase